MARKPPRSHHKRAALAAANAAPTPQPRSYSLRACSFKESMVGRSEFKRNSVKRTAPRKLRKVEQNVLAAAKSCADVELIALILRR